MFFLQQRHRQGMHTVVRLARPPPNGSYCTVLSWFFLGSSTTPKYTPTHLTFIVVEEHGDVLSSLASPKAFHRSAVRGIVARDRHATIGSRGETGTLPPVVHWRGPHAYELLTPDVGASGQGLSRPSFTTLMLAVIGHTPTKSRSSRRELRRCSNRLTT